MLWVIFCVKEYCIVIDFEKREKKNYIDVYVTLPLSSQNLSLYSIFFSTDLGGFPGNQETPLGAPLSPELHREPLWTWTILAPCLVLLGRPQAPSLALLVCPVHYCTRQIQK